MFPCATRKTDPYFYPRSPCGERLFQRLRWPCIPHFYPRSPCGERPKSIADYNKYGVFLSTLSLRRATLSRASRLGERQYFYPRSPCGERHFEQFEKRDAAIFLSTLSLRRATAVNMRSPAMPSFLSTLSLRRATTGVQDHGGRVIYFYPRSPCGERPLSAEPARNLPNFYPRSPCGERRPDRQGADPCGQISIHALLAESDAYGRINDISRLIFLSTLSLRRATEKAALAMAGYTFLSTLSLRRATHTPRSAGPWQGISIHALLAESDLDLAVRFSKTWGFLSTLSLRRATVLGRC